MASAAFRLSLQVMIWIGWPLIPPALLMASAAASAPFTLSTKLAAGVARMPVAMILTGEPDAATSLLALAPAWELLVPPWEPLAARGDERRRGNRGSSHGRETSVTRYLTCHSNFSPSLGSSR